MSSYGSTSAAALLRLPDRYCCKVLSCSRCAGGSDERQLEKSSSGLVLKASSRSPLLQAQDRCHRIGQTRPVHIYRLVSEATIEENILAKSDQKRQVRSRHPGTPLCSCV